MVVADASLVVDFLIDGREKGEWATAVLEASGAVCAPHLVDLEVASALRARAIAGELDPGRAAAAIDDLASFTIERYPATHLLERVWQLRHRLTCYDASYVALAEALEVPLATTDPRLARAGGHRAEIVAFDV